MYARVYFYNNLKNNFMKKVFFPLFFLITTGVYSQVARIETVSGRINSHSDVEIKKNSAFTTDLIKEISANMWIDFIRMFNNPADVLWYIDKEEITAYFNYDSESVIVRYKRNGHLISIRKAYQGNKLNSFVADFLNREIKKGFIINMVTELTVGDNTIYEISLQDEKRWCVLQIFQNNELRVLEIIEIKEFKKR